MANEADLKLIEIPQFPPTTTLEGSGAERIPVTKADGVTYSISTEDFKAFLGVDALMQMGGAITPASTLPAEGDYFWPATEPGTYANAGGVVVPENSLALISRVDGVYSISSTEIEGQDLSGLATKVELEKLTDVSDNKAGTLLNGYYDKTTGAFVANAGFRATSKIPVSLDDMVRRVGQARTTDGSAASAIAAYDSSGALVGYIGIITSDYSFVVKDRFPATTTHLTFGSTSSIPLEVYINSVLKQQVVEGLPLLSANVATLVEKTLKDYDYATEGITGYYDVNGVLQASGSASWGNSGKVSTSEGDVFEYSGLTPGSLAQAVVAWDELGVAQVLHGTISSQADRTIIVPAGIVEIAGSSRTTGTDVFKFIGKKINTPEIPDIETIPESFMPQKSWAIQGQELRINPFGIVAKHPEAMDVDVSWSVENGNEKFLRYTPGAETSKVISLNVRDVSGKFVNIGSVDIKVTNAIVNPSSSVNIVFFGDSLVEGIGSLVDGAMSNEISRRLTGVGTALLSGSESPAGGSLTNIYFRGTRGDQPIKHEGRGGWRINEYINNASKSGVINAFYNPTTSKFDIGYYLTQNNFNEGQTTGGVNATGSNLCIVIELVWNHVYNHTEAQVAGYLREILDLIHAQKPAAKVKLVGVPCPAYPNTKTYEGVRSVSVESIMREAIVKFSNVYQGVSLEPAYIGFVEFISVAPFFFPLKSYASQEVPVSARDSELMTVYTDYVHPNNRGYAQMADVIYRNIVYNYCR